MVEGAFSFLLFLFTSPQHAISNQLQGYWRVTIDNTIQARDWYRIYYFEKCSGQELESDNCHGHYGWAEYEGIFLNLYDKNYLTYGIENDKSQSTGRRRILLSSNYYDFILNTNKKTIRLLNTETGQLELEMEKIPKKEVRLSE